mgnify:CR=1 FL=1
MVRNGAMPHGKGRRSMTGEYQHSLDNKGRLFIPAKLRDELGETDAWRELSALVERDRCLSVYSAENWQVFSDKVNAMPYVKQRKMRPLFAYAARCELDSQGRALIPQNLRDYAGLVKNVTVVGCNNHAELWDSENWAAVYSAETTPENIAAVMEELEF